MPLIPYRNFRHLLTLRAKESPEKPLLIIFDAGGKREKIAYAEMIARIQQTANLLDDLGVRAGDSVAVRVDDPSSAALIYYACWMMGAVAFPMKEDAPRLNMFFNPDVFSENANPLKTPRIAFIEAAHLQTTASWAHPQQQVVQVGGEPHPDYLHFHETVRQMATTYVEDKPTSLDSSALGIYQSHHEPRLAPYSFEVFSQRVLLAGALSLASAQAITGNQTVMRYGLADPVFALVLPLVTGVPSVICQTFSPEMLWHRAVHEKVNIVQIHSSMLQPLLDYAAEQEPQGNLMFGEKIRRQELMRFRHFLSTDIPPQEVMQAFEDKFGFAVMAGYKPYGAASYITLPPMTLTWAERRRLAFDIGAIYVGEVVEGCQIEINSDEHISFSGDTIADGFLKPVSRITGDVGFWGEDGQSLFLYEGERRKRVGV